MAQQTTRTSKIGTQSKSRKAVVPRHRTQNATKLESRYKRLSGSVKEVVYVQLGVAGTVYDNLNELRTKWDSRIKSVRSDAPKQWKELVKRGEKVEKDMRKSTADIQKRVGGFDLKSNIEARFDQVREGLDKVRNRFSKAA